MKAGDLVRVQQGMKKGKLALITEIGLGHIVEVVVDSRRARYYRRDLEVINESR